MERDVEMQCSVNVVGQSTALTMVVTRWGFVQCFKDNQSEKAALAWYIYDYSLDGAAMDDLTAVLLPRQHTHFAHVASVGKT